MGFGQVERIPLVATRSRVADAQARRRPAAAANPIAGSSPRDRTRVMISCGEPSGDLYAGALVSALTAIDPAIDVFGFGGATSRRGRRGSRRRLSRRVRHRSGGGPVACCRARGGCCARSNAAARDRRPDVFVAIDFPDFNFRLLLGHPQARHSGRLLREPAALGLARGAARDDSPRRLAHARHLSVRAGDVRARRRARRVRRPSAGGSGGSGPASRSIPDARSAWTPASRCSRCCRAAGRTNSATCCRPWSRRCRSSRRTCRACSSSSRARRRSTTRCSLRSPRLRPGRRPSPSSSMRPTTCSPPPTWCVTASGTATVQAALHGRPMVIVYRLSASDLRDGPVVRARDDVRHGQSRGGPVVVPELIQDAFTPAAVAREAVSLLTDRTRVETMRRDLAEVRARLGGPGASRRAAEAVLSVVRTR